MKDYIRKRVLDICQYILDSKQTVRQTAAVFGVSKSTVHKELPKVNGKGLYELNRNSIKFPPTRQGGVFLLNESLVKVEVNKRGGLKF